MRLFLDEQISPVVSSRLRERGFDVVSPHDLGTCGQSDPDHFAWSAVNGRGVVTYNIADFRLLADQYLARGRDHSGLIFVSERTIPQRDLGALLRALEAMLTRDILVVQSLVLIFALTYVLANLTVDVLYGWLDPRIRYT